MGVLFVLLYLLGAVAESGRRLLTPEEVGERLNVPASTLYKWRYSRSGPPALKLGKYLRYDPDELDRWLKARGAA